MAGVKEKEFGNWLKLRRLAAELTPLDLCKYLGIEIAAYRAIELGDHPVTETMIVALSRLEKLKVTERDLRSKAPVVLPAAEGEEVSEKPVGELDTILAGAATARQRIMASAATAAKNNRPPFATYIEAEGQRVGITPFELSNRSGVAVDVLAEIEGGRIPGLVVLRKLADALGIPHEVMEKAARGEA